MGIDNTLSIVHVSQLDDKKDECPWLIESIWAKSAVGILGGPPKCCKSWLGLDMAVSIASGTPCLDQFVVAHKGSVLIYLAEDTLTDVRLRINALCEHRQLNIQQLDLFVITTATLRLDLEKDQQKLREALEEKRPRLLLLDPLVRLHQLDENSSSDISRLLRFLRELQRCYDCAIVLVHHASKKHRAQQGQALRGSSDLHAFGDSNAYLMRKQERLILTLEQRRAKPLQPIELELISVTDNITYLQIVSPVQENALADLKERTLICLRNTDEPQTRTTLRNTLKVNNKRLGDTLAALENKGLVIRQKNGWVAVKNHSNYPKPVSDEHPVKTSLSL
jgi:hypothetical protein